MGILRSKQHDIRAGLPMNARTETVARAAVETVTGRKVLFTAVRNEAPFLLEWVAYHQVIGFDLIVIASNDCDDGATELADALAELGNVVHIAHEVPVDARPQASAARLVNDRHLLSDGDWAIWLDADEFLNVLAGEGLVDDLLRAIAPHDGALINWRLFGDGGNARFPGRFVSEAFSTASAPEYGENEEVKTLFRMGPWIEGFADRSINRPKLIPQAGEDSTTPSFVTPAGQPIDRKLNRHRSWYAGRQRPAQRTAAPHERGYAFAQINHYTVRTPDMFALKGRRGRG
jgi:hypothetical protein